jgi:hypothetical protein
MASNYASFHVQIDNLDGTFPPVATATVKIHNAASGALLATVTADADGIVAGGTVTLAVGSRLRFKTDLGDGRAGWAEQLTT